MKKLRCMSPAATLAAVTETYNQIQPLAAHSITGNGGRLPVICNHELVKDSLPPPQTAHEFLLGSRDKFP
jgi:hypothetical protein